MDELMGGWTDGWVNGSASQIHIWV